MSDTRPLTSPGPLRTRPRHGQPRCVIEDVAQWTWKHRVELMLLYIVLSVSLGIWLQVR